MRLQDAAGPHPDTRLDAAPLVATAVTGPGADGNGREPPSQRLGDVAQRIAAISIISAGRLAMGPTVVIAPVSRSMRCSPPSATT